MLSTLPLLLGSAQVEFRDERVTLDSDVGDSVSGLCHRKPPGSESVRLYLASWSCSKRLRALARRSMI